MDKYRERGIILNGLYDDEVCEAISCAMNTSKNMSEETLDSELRTILNDIEKVYRQTENLRKTHVLSRNKDTEEYIVKMIHFLSVEVKSALEDTERLLLKAEDGHVYY